LPQKKRMKVYRLREKGIRRDEKRLRGEEETSADRLKRSRTDIRDERVRNIGESRSEEEIECCIGSGPRASRSNNYRFNGYANGPSVTR